MALNEAQLKALLLLALERKPQPVHTTVKETVTVQEKADLSRIESALADARRVIAGLEQKVIEVSGQVNAVANRPLPKLPKPSPQTGVADLELNDEGELVVSLHGKEGKRIKLPRERARWGGGGLSREDVVRILGEEGAAAVWGGITGTLSNQTDLQTALNAKEATGVAAAGDAAHVAAGDPHTQYQRESEKGAVSGYASLDAGGTVPDAQIPATIARDTEVTAAITAHEAAADPHPTYLTAAEGNAAYEVVGAVATHAAAADPHTGYQKESERNAASGYAGLDGSSKLTGSQQVYGSGVNTACEGNDARLSDSRTPLAHATSHKSGGSDAIKLDELAAPTDVTTLNATTALHGLLRKLDGLTTTFLRGDGTWAAPTAAAADPTYATGSFTLATGTGRVHPKILELSGAQVATLQGTARLVLCG